MCVRERERERERGRGERWLDSDVKAIVMVNGISEPS